MGGQLTYAERIMTSGRVFLEYLMLIFFPLNLPGDYDFNAIPIAGIGQWDAWLGLLLIVSIVAGAIFLRRRAPAFSLGILFAFLVIVPASNWIFPISVLMAERFLYLPLAGLALAGGMIFSTLRNHRLERLIGAGFLLTAIVLCNSHDYIRRNDFSFFANMVRIQPNSAKARLGYGYALLQAGRKEEAVEQLEAGLRIIPDFPEFLTTLAMTRMTQKSCDQAWPLLRRASEIDPSHANTQRQMADCLFKEGRLKEAEAMYRQALSGIPFPDSLLYVMWAQTLEDTGERESAISAYERAALIDPQNVIIQEKLTALRAQ
jgi:tetratricopeptide (TPR) repeat protein